MGQKSSTRRNVLQWFLIIFLLLSSIYLLTFAISNKADLLEYVDGLFIKRPRPLSATKLIDDPTLKAYWPLDGNSNDVKEKYHGFDTDVTYSKVYGLFGEGAFFNGVSSFIRVEDTLHFADTPFSIGAWINVPSFHEYQTVISKATYFDPGYNLGIATYGSSKGADIGNPTDGSITYEYGTHFGYSRRVITPDDWHFLLYTREISGKNEINKIYIDGILDPHSYTVTKQWFMNDNYFVIGGRDKGGKELHAIFQFFHGFMDDVFIFSRALSASEAFQIWTGDFRSVTSK
jgi:hypothetical protein